ncbi:SMC-Scp complex subunit ScpB [Pseudidiomarina terrestris]|uniref:SMC-Scp complex subunit ScpB n=1 Tax=Pseudidiomarina terrestris TaxID=2820060 RepID=A0AAW7QXR5_9GAMM|nr:MULTISPECIES: SMC-Scp complex subunit ScpB [unclassified Pseudidiomarina]MDN7123863.1 SMC-Scp complex subunit ScpB [Pseudidiomarina sp. 1APP75-32.1]MDN7127617.1 SMC-Scp complex subunit ScpB [Pseudidiomarina sp. 1APR75-33.1]MDN7130363.1 SMC-Scp complex subunit ScpB [Pseudidiomarina sp. 1APR75-15]MDN7136286.1 SMC-Scp complex subunit ScpB [Pseudidiomarina sp. 1ASP75-5]MDN7138797.1 SMC-Scp complex subunit ScpB [Pseudidiomarina sp. 1ASP75-14]
MQNQQIKQIIEAVLFVADTPLSVAQLNDYLLEHGMDATRKTVRETLEELQRDYQERGVQLYEVASGYRFQTRAELGGIIAGLWQEKPPRYSQALLETLALIAYRQPITRGDIEEIRGVSVSSQIMKTLQERGWVKVVGHREVPGRPQLYATTSEFLDYFNLKDLSELPAIPEPPAKASNTGPITQERPAETATEESESAP